MVRAALLAVSSLASIFSSASLVSAGIKPQAALAYTDPGSGALLLQYLTMGGLFLAFYFSRARSWVARRLGWSQQPSNEENTNSQPEKSEGPNTPS